jgi:hypothetical protein
LKSTRRFQGHSSQRLGRAVALANWPSVKTEGRWYYFFFLLREKMAGET